MIWPLNVCLKKNELMVVFTFLLDMFVLAEHPALYTALGTLSLDLWGQQLLSDGLEGSLHVLMVRGLPCWHWQAWMSTPWMDAGGALILDITKGAGNGLCLVQHPGINSAWPPEVS